MGSKILSAGGRTIWQLNGELGNELVKELRLKDPGRSHRRGVAMMWTAPTQLRLRQRACIGRADTGDAEHGDRRNTLPGNGHGSVDHHVTC
eukprot:1459042-Amphidinium_carterae.1